MFTSMSITSWDQGKELARWHVNRLYGGQLDPDIDRSERGARMALSATADPVATPVGRRWRLSVLIRYRQAVPSFPHGKGHGISAA